MENPTYRLLGAAPAWTRYLVPTFRFTALSDEKREGLLGLPVNLATGAMPDAMLARLQERKDRCGPVSLSLLMSLRQAAGVAGALRVLLRVADP